ncbi:2-keto-3-deoxygluconate permease [Clostridium sp. BL-8]|uniref:2-keto-3-deoxygluconate permease n=1 Tax=Clostridium sp. BL-8 TaxID=349938 RepID=UPI00098BEDF7|nr:2-keto-3-deoxygluconate permease [Clostridium sp. BL-8]OOM75703.1 2-keto-3-deoxygluconate permease [Clostridium sp. BL-8]
MITVNNEKEKSKSNLRILDRVKNIPGGLMLIPMAIGAIINTFSPKVVQIGNPTSAIFSSNGTMCIVGIMIVFIGIQIRPNQLLLAIKRGGVLILTKLIIGIIAGLVIMKLFGLDGFLGISTLALVSCITSCNPGMYIALMDQYGDEIDIANYAFLNLIGLPFIPICILGFAGGYGIDYKSIAATCIPFFVGMFLGGIDDNIREFTKSGSSIMTPFLGFCLGSNINILTALSSYTLGFILLIIFSIVNNIPMLFVDKIFLKQKGYASTAICCVAGLSIAVPKLMGEIDALYLPYVETAASQIAFVVVISTIITPILVKKLSK